MTADPIILESSSTILEAVEIFTSKKITAAPVHTSLGQIAGKLTELGLVRIVVLHQLQPEKYHKLANCLNFLEPAAFVRPDDPVATVIKEILHSSSRRVLVKDHDRIVGIISPKDLLRVLMTESNEAEVIKQEIHKMGDSRS